MSDPIGLGCTNFSIAAYIENRPSMMNYASLNTVTPVIPGEIHAIGQACGNGWRKVFSVYAKLLFALETGLFPYAANADKWQDYRDQYLLQAKSQSALLFTPPAIHTRSEADQEDQLPIHIIMGRTYAKRLISEKKLTIPMQWLDNEFAINTKHNVIVCPYFDYRQLSNVKITRLAELIKSLRAKQTT